MVEQASSFFEAASAARDQGLDRELQNETRPTHLRTPSLPEVALRGKDSPLHAAIDALQPEPQSGPGSSIDD